MLYCLQIFRLPAFEGTHPAERSDINGEYGYYRDCGIDSCAAAYVQRVQPEAESE
jgi:hypothetical protein